MDGIAARKEMRGKGIGTKLLEELKRYAHREGFARIRLDVIDTNSAARRLCERRGFVPTHTESFGFLRRFLRFGAATTMMWSIEEPTRRTGP
ncbi:MAG: GNAT family N-acetyltransferase [Holophagales bacterium]|nr:GNAT family N-acetyltransferase [Holophagales bacterium]